MLLGNNEACSFTNDDNNNGKLDTSIGQSSSGSSTVQLQAVQAQISEEGEYLHIFFMSFCFCN